LRQWRHHVTKVLHVLKHGGKLLMVGLLYRFDLLLVGLMHLSNLLLRVPLRLFYLPLLLGLLCCKLGLQYLI
jgi:hypothetical protein